ncbi:ABC-2 type transport system ATP-binding protein [Alkalihalobacillus xiaoxiensis]|uniref:ABC-2 type transport system ATP-binding protein n=1 Tax=Shouchella xiaoxiensis TaxID=766895 RepID=A0ABS2SUB3_9BACI|nr:ABC transporter ATP-binding protein [Shouchella xiaoxiensis]MBM7839138.1 ABC-2 type transport system ATP-binding protein [Shouchella xiaoxiensis]
MNSTYAIEVNGLTKSFGDQTAVQDLHLQIEHGQIFGLLGHNGAGKSTTIDCILGTQTASAGTIHLLGADPIKDRKHLFQKVGVQFQENAFQLGLKVNELCEITHSLYKNPLDWKEKLAEFGLESKAKKTITDLSGGERQKLCILLAMMGNPEVIFLDELTTGLDPVARRDIWKTLKQLNAAGVTIFLTSHFMDEVEQLCDRIVILKNGRPITSGTVAEVIEASDAKNMDEAFLKLIGEDIL